MCPKCGLPGYLHDIDKVTDYATGWNECTVTKAITQARAEHAGSPQGLAETKAAADGAADPREWRAWVYWPYGTPPPDYSPLD